MFFVRTILAVSIVGVTLTAGCGPRYVAFGEPMKLSAPQSVSVSEVLADKKAYDGKYVRVSGRVTGVCAKKGCWLRMGDGASDETVFVKFTCPVEGRLVPMEAVSHDVVVEGKVTVEEVSEADARHYAEDAGRSPEAIAGIVGPQRSVRIASPAARVFGISTSTR